MANMWWDYFKLWSFVFTSDPLSQKDHDKQITGAGVSQPDAIPDIRQDGSFWGGSRGMIRLRDSNDFVDLSSVTNRQSRYKEYERLRNVAEIETAMTVFSDESCLAGSTIVSTLFYGPQTIQWLEQNKATEEFLVYCWDFAKKDYTLGWAYNPRVVKTDETVKVMLDDGSTFICTPDHKVLLMNGDWTHAGQLAFGNELKPFYRVPAVQSLTKLKNNQFPRIYTNEGWKQERQFIEEWKSGVEIQRCENVNKAIRMIAGGLNTVQIAKLLEKDWRNIEEWIHKAGFSYKEIKQLAKKKEYRRVIGVIPYETMPVYDLSVREYENFCGNSVIFHNCQTNDEGHTIKIQVKDKEVKEELEFLLFHLKMLNVDKKIWNWVKNLFIMGDLFIELVTNLENPKDGILKSLMLPPESIYRIETTKGRLIEFQQSKEGPDQDSLTKAPITQATEEELRQSTAIRFHPEQIIHVRIGDDRKTFYPYGVSLMEAARGPAHQLRLMEDAMVVYRLTRAPERRVFYVDVGTLPPFKAEAFIDRMKDQFRKKKVASGKGGATGASQVEERWHAPAQDEDYWIPIRQNSQTRIETLPGACLDLNTKVPLLDGRILPLFNIIEEYNQGKKLWAYSCCPNTGKTAPGLISWAGVTRKNTQVLKVNFDNGESITCTPDHKFPVQGRGKVEAKDLQVGDSMFPFITRMEKLSNSWKSKYEQVYNSFTRSWEFTHRMVMKEIDNTSYKETTIFDEKNKDLKKKVIHHKNYNRLNNSPENLTWMNYIDHLLLHREHQDITNNNISISLKEYHENMSEENKKIRDKKLSERGIKGNAKTLEKLKDKIFNLEFRKKQSDGWKKAIKERPELHKNRGQKITARNNEFWSNLENKKTVFEKQTIIYPKSLFDKFIELQKQGCLLTETLNLINQDKELINQFVVANNHIIHAIAKKSLLNGLNTTNVNKMCKAYGYNGVKHARKEAINYNHKVISIEFLEEKMDTGTLTIDGNHEIHNYHTFAISGCGIYTYNSNLGEIDDAVYFRNKLFTAMNFPKNYFSNEDPNATRITLSAQDVKFARQIERLQSAVEDGIWEMCDRHLRLRGFPEETYDDLKVKMTPPSDWRELSKAEVLTNRMTNANNAKGAQLFSDYDIYMDYLKMTEDEAKERLGRLKIQKLEDLKLQVLAQNPVLLGVASPGQGDQEIGSSSGGPNPMLSPDAGAPPGMPPAGGAPPGGTPPAFASDDGPPDTGVSTTVLTDPTEDDIKRYDLDIEDYAKDMDLEQPDFSEI